MELSESNKARLFELYRMRLEAYTQGFKKSLGVNRKQLLKESLDDVEAFNEFINDKSLEGRSSSNGTLVQCMDRMQQVYIK